MDEMAESIQKQRHDAWKKKFKEKIGRDSLSSRQDYIVAGNIFDLLDDLRVQTNLKQPSFQKDQQTTTNDVCLYPLIRYPPAALHLKRFMT